MTYALILFWNLAALVPIALGWWDVFAVLGLYWFENVCTGLFQYLRIRDAERANPSPGPIPFFLHKFFAMHYGLFTGVHGIFVLAFFGFAMGGMHSAGQGWLISALAIVGFQYASYRFDWQAHQGWKATSPGKLMAEPYARVVVLHLIVIVGGYLALSAHSSQAILLLFAALKLLSEWLTQFLWRRFALKAAV